MKNKKILLFSIVSLALTVMSINQGLCVDALAQHTPDFVESLLSPTVKATAIKFLKVMLGVVISSVVIYMGLFLYNKFVAKRSAFVAEDSDNVLLTPKTVDGAVASFIKRNKI